MSRRTTDDVAAEWAESREQIQLRVRGRTVVIEGSREALLALSGLIAAQARDARDCGFQMEPRGPGTRVFMASSTHGFYIHRVPCDGHYRQRVVTRKKLGTYRPSLLDITESTRCIS